MTNAPTEAPRARFLDRTTPPHIATLVLIASLGALNLNIVLPSLPALAEHFETPYAMMQLAVSAYLAMTAIMQLIIGPLSDRYGRRPVLIGSIIIFLLATIGAMFAPNAETFLAFRLLQATIISGFSLSRAIVRDLVPMEKAASMIGYVTMGMTLVPMLTPVVAGLLEEWYGWRAPLGFAVISGLIILFIIWQDLAETNRYRSASMGEQFRNYPELLTSRRFWGFSLTSMFASGSFFAFLGGAPYVAVNHLDLAPAALGLYFIFVGIGYMLGNFLSGRHASRIGVFTMMKAGCIAATLGSVISILYFAFGYSHPLGFFGPLLFVGLGNGLTLPSANAGMVSVRPHLAGSAAGLGGALQIGGGAALSMIAGYLLTVESGPAPLLWLMLASSLLSLLAALYTLWVDRRMASRPL